MEHDSAIEAIMNPYNYILKSVLLFRLVHGTHLQADIREPSWSDDTFLDSHLFYLII